MTAHVRFARRVRIIALISAALSCSMLIAADNPADWPQFRGPAGLGVSKDKGLPTTWSDKENVVWKIELPGPGTSSPILVGKHIFLTCYTGYAVPGQPRGSMDDLKLLTVCLDRATGKQVWTKEITPKLPEQAAIRESHGYASGTPAADQERLYCFFGKSGVVAYDHAGQQLWQTEVGSQLNGWGSGTSPVLFEDLVLVNASVESASIVALNRNTGKEVWRAGGIKESWNTPILVATQGGKTELVVAIFGKLLGLDPKSGKQLWSCDTDIGWYMAPSLVSHAGVIYAVGGRSGGALAVRAGGQSDVTRTHRLWTGRKGSNVTSPLYHEGHVYWMHENNGIAYCAEAATGKVVYEQRVERADQIYASPVLADGKIYYISRSGRTFVVAAKPQYELLATNTFPDRSAFNASPAVGDGRLYIRSDRFLYCLGVKN